MRLAFAGTPQSAAEVLAALLAERRHRVECVLTMPDRPAGRGRRVRSSPVRQCAEAHGIPLLLAARADDIEAERLRGLDLLVVVAYGVLLPAKVLAMPRWGGLNVHFSLLPRWRGASPVQRAILAGDQQTGVSLMRMDAGLDTGPLYQQTACPIALQDTAATLLARLTERGITALLSCLEQFATDKPATPQQGPSCHAPKISTRESWIDWQQDADSIDRKIRALNPAPVARTRWGPQLLRIWQARPVTSVAQNTPGTVLQCDRNGLVVMAGQGALRIDQLQAAGRRVMAAGVFINGLREPFALGKFTSDTVAEA